MMQELETPCVVVDLKKLKINITEMADLAARNKVELWPMIKTHKSDYILNLQIKNGAKGILVAKLGEAEIMANAGAEQIIMGYPVIGKEKLNRLYRLSKEVKIICSIDSKEAAFMLDDTAMEYGTGFECVIIVDSGLKRLGVSIDELKKLYRDMAHLKGIRVVGAATHGGHVYGALDQENVKKTAREEADTMREAAKILEEEGAVCDFVALGSTPTVKTLDNFNGIKQIRPGNYVFYDALQVALGIVPEERCALTAFATVISVPEPGRAILDIGSKVLGLDAGTHGSSIVKGYGIVKNHPGITIKGLSEELGKLVYDPDKESLVIGQTLEIIPNHACSVVNMVDKLYGVEDGRVVKIIPVSARGMFQ